jgi:hypothetical protein
MRRRVRTEKGFCTSVVGNVCSVPILRPLAHSNACGDTCQQWLTPAQAGLQSKRRGRSVIIRVYSTDVF